MTILSYKNRQILRFAQRLPMTILSYKNRQILRFAQDDEFGGDDISGAASQLIAN
jgi:hypothetical protein